MARHHYTPTQASEYQRLSHGKPGTRVAREIPMLVRALFSVIDKPIGSSYASDEFLIATKLGAL